jgi:predicted nucleic acid-binding protein
VPDEAAAAREPTTNTQFSTSSPRATARFRHADKDWSLCDAISFVVMDARRIGTAFSFDRHFRQYGKLVVLGPA